jgi:hypothetical protein
LRARVRSIARVLAREPGQSGLKRVTEQAAPRAARRLRRYKTPAKLGVERSLGRTPTQSSLGRPTTHRVPAPFGGAYSSGPSQGRGAAWYGSAAGGDTSRSYFYARSFGSTQASPFWARSSDRISNSFIDRGPGLSVRTVVLCGRSVSVRSSPEEVGHRTQRLRPDYAS